MIDNLQAIYRHKVLSSELINLQNKIISIADIESVKDAVPDDSLVLEKIYPLEEIEVIFERIHPYLEGENVVPFLNLLGDNCLCISISDQDDSIFYWDADFGIFKIAESIESLINLVVDE